MDLSSNVAHHSNYSEISNHLRETATQRYNHKTTNNKATITTKFNDLLHRTQPEYSTSTFDQCGKRNRKYSIAFSSVPYFPIELFVSLCFRRISSTLCRFVCTPNWIR